MKHLHPDKSGLFQDNSTPLSTGHEGWQYFEEHENEKVMYHSLHGHQINLIEHRWDFGVMC